MVHQAASVRSDAAFLDFLARWVSARRLTSGRKRTRIASQRSMLQARVLPLLQQLSAAVAFPTTTWSVVLKARDQDLTGFRQALEKLCRMYWYPVYAYIRRHGHSVEDAEDLTQEFFSRIIEKNSLRAVNEGHGRFRWFLLTALKRFLVNQWSREQTKKRGGDFGFLSLEFIGAEGRYSIEPVHDMTPEKLFQRGWGLTILDRALSRLREEHTVAGDALDFDRLKALVANS
jgi:DNA-directed RNA polymerase specialized sigma24 family protein